MRACWLKWVGRDWSISADYIWLNYSGANTRIQGLILTNCGMDVTSVEINPFVVDLCKKNTAINSLDDETRVLEGSLYSPLRDDSCFSLVVVNPPLLPIPDEIPYPFV